VYRLTVTGLRWGANTLRAVVVNEGGRTESDPVVASYPPNWTAAVKVDRLERQDKPGAFVALAEKAPAGDLLLHGHVEWRKAGDPCLRRPVRLRVWVNEFEQPDVALEPARGLRRAFTARVRLNRERNQIHLQLPSDVKPSPDSALDVRVACARPEKEQRLHLVVLGPGERDPKALRRRVLRAFLAEKEKGDEFQTRAFRQGRVYGPLAGDVSREGLNAFLDNLKLSIRSSGGGALNDVVVLFFTGEEAVRGGKHYLLTEESRQEPARLEESALDCDTIRESLSDFPGAKLLLLDARRRSGGSASADRDDYPHLGFCRYVWLGAADAPEKARLLHALGWSLSRKPLVGDQLALIKKWAGGFGRNAWFQELFPPGLRLLQLGGAERK
jgi:hypothetical protein